MRGHIQEKKGNLYVVLELDPIDGKRNTKWISVRKELGLNRPAKKKEAEALLIRKLKELQDGAYFEPTDKTLAECLEIWLDNHVRVNCKQTTIDFYEGLIYNHINPEIGHLPAAKIRPIHIQKLLTKKTKGGRMDGKSGGLSRRTIQGIRSLLKQALGELVEWEMLPRNPAAKAKQKRGSVDKKKTTAWSREEVETFLAFVKRDPRTCIDTAAAEAWLQSRKMPALARGTPLQMNKTLTVAQYAQLKGVDISTVYLWLKQGMPASDTGETHRLYPLYLMALTTGMRRGEILGLRWEDVSFSKAQITIRQNLVATSKGASISTPKTADSERTIDISPQLVEVLKKHKIRQTEEFNALGIKPDHNLVFTSEAGTPIAPRNLYRHFNSVLDKLHGQVKRISFHNLRDTHATLLLEEGVHVKAVAERLGHTDAVTLLRRYAHALPKISKEAAVKLDSLIPE
jgi:integrase